MLDLAPSTVRTLTEKGELPAKRLGRRRVYRYEDLLAYREALPDWDS